MTGREKPSRPALDTHDDTRDWVRARRPEQKQARSEAIMRAAIELLDEGGIEAASLSAIARQAGISKANIYRYFESREAILLAVTLAEVESWATELETQLRAIAGSGDLDAIADLVAGTTAARPRTCALISSLSSVLERNVEADLIAGFKRHFGARVVGLVEVIHAAAPTISIAHARAFMTFFYGFAAGAWPMANPSPVVAQVLAREEFAAMCVDFDAMLHSHARVLLRGLAASSDP